MNRTTLKSDRLKLRQAPRYEDEKSPDLAKIAGWLNNKEHMQYSEQRHTDHSARTVLTYRQYHNGHEVIDRETRFLWDIHLRHTAMHSGADDELAGTLTAYIDERNRRADMGILISPMYAGMGYGLDAWKLAMGFVFTRVPRIFAGMMAHNRGMRRICEKSGMCECGRVTGYFQFNGEPEDAVFYRRDK